MSSTHSPADVLAKQQRAFLLHKLASEGGELTLAKAIKIPTWATKQLDLTPDATPLLDVLIAEQLVVGIQKGKTKKVGITQAGREALEHLTEFVPQPPTPKEKKPSPPKKSLAEQTAEKVRAKVAELGAAPVSAGKLGKPGGKIPKPEAVAAFEQTVRELVADGTLFEHPGGKYGKYPVLTPAKVVRAEVQAKLDTAEGPFKLADLSKPKRGASAEEKTAHAGALANVIDELIHEKKLFPHPGGLYGHFEYKEPDHPDRELREVYTLHQFFRAPDHTISKADIELAIRKGKPDKKELDAKYPHVARFRGQGCFEMGAPATRQTLEHLVAAGELRRSGEADAGEYTLTDAGTERLKRSRAAFPVLPPVGVPATPDDAAMREMWEVFVLLRLTEATDFTAAEGVVFAGGYPKGSKLNEATAWVLYGELAKAGYVTAKWNGTEGEYTLTPNGVLYLAGLSFDGFDKLEVKGAALTALLAAARGGAKTPATSPTPPTGGTPSPADLEAAVMDIFHRLLRERHANIRMVPIHEVRAEIRQRFGEQAASREVFNELLLDMRRGKKVRLVSITDRNQATDKQLQDSVSSVGETFFYLEAAHAPVSSG